MYSASKISEDKVKLATSAANALKRNPVSVAFTGVAAGNDHTLTAKDANSKVIVAIDNMIQSPIVATSVTTGLSTSATPGKDIIFFTGITSFFAGDFVKLGTEDDDEIVKIVSIGIGTTNAIKVRRNWFGTGLGAHAKDTLVTKIEGNYNIVGNTINFAEAPYGNRPIGSATDPPSFRDWTGITTSSTFFGRSFMRSGPPGSTVETYTKNHIYDDISQGFDGLTREFILTSDKQNLTGITTSTLILVNGIFQGLGENSNYTVSETAGITSISFTGTASSVSYDVNNANIPVGGVLLSVGSTTGFGYQPLVAAGATVTISAGGTVSAISIGNSGSGYRSGIQTTVNVAVASSSTGTPILEFIGTAAISGGHIVSIAVTNPGSGYSSTNPPEVVIDKPLSYENIPLVYASNSTGVGTGGKVDIVVGQGSSVIEFNISNTGFGYKVGQTLTIGIGGTVGIPTDPTKTLDNFEITVDRVDGDSFNAWSVGEFQVLDEFSSLFNGQRVVFPIKSEGEFLSIVAAKGSNISIQDNLLIFINDIIQVPGESYEFLGGSSIRFIEAPKSGDSVKILLYRGTGEIDVNDVDVTETVKVGDTLQFKSGNFEQNQNKRSVSTIISASSVNTNVYPGPGLTKNEKAERPIEWCRQRDDVLINGKVIPKSRGLYEPNIFPTAYIIKSVGVGSTAIYVDNVRPGFNPINESQLSVAFQNKVSIFDYNVPVGAAATANVSTAGTITSITLSSGGVGYSTTPDVTIGNPVGLGSTLRATAVASLTAGVVTGVTITAPGTGYTSTNPPVVLIGPPAGPETENNTITSYSGDFGVITGISTTSVGVASTGIVFDLLIEANSPLRDNTGVTAQTTTSGIATGDYFIVYESNVGSGVTALDESGNTIGVGNSFLDNIYRVADVSIANTSSIGIGTTNVARVTVSIAHYNGFTAAGLAISSFYGRYSWGKLLFSERDWI